MRFSSPSISSPPLPDKKVKRLGKPSLFTLVRHIDLSWNTLEPSLVLMHEKLVDLGWVYYSGEVHIIEPETERSDFHETS